MARQSAPLPAAELTRPVREDFAEFYTAYHRRLLAFCYRAFSRGDAEEIAQETLARVCAAFDRLEPHRDPWPFLTVVARNVARDLYRASSRVVVDSDAVSALIRDTGPAADDVVADRETRAELTRALRCLTPRQQQILQLREVDVMSCTDIAELLGIEPNAARQQLFRARRALAAAYAKVTGAVRGFWLVTVITGTARSLRRGRHVVPAVAVQTALVAAVATLATTGDLGAQHSAEIRARESVLRTRSTATSGSVVRDRASERPGVQRLATPAVVPEPATVQTVARIGDPMARGENYRVGVTVTTPVGEIWIEAVGVTGDGARPVCHLLPAVSC